MAKLCSVPLWVTSRKPLGYGLCGALGGSDWGAMQDPLQQKPPCRSGPDELIPMQILLGRSVSEDDCR